MESGECRSRSPRGEQKQRIRRRHVAVHQAVGDEQFALEILRQQLVGLVVVVRRAVGRGLQKPLPFLAPIVFVVAVVVVSGAGDGHLVEVVIAENTVG